MNQKRVWVELEIRICEKIRCSQVKKISKLKKSGEVLLEKLLFFFGGGGLISDEFMSTRIYCKNLPMHCEIFVIEKYNMALKILRWHLLG